MEIIDYIECTLWACQNQTAPQVANYQDDNPDVDAPPKVIMKTLPQLPSIFYAYDEDQAKTYARAASLEGDLHLFAENYL